MSWSVAYLWNFAPIFAGLGFFYLISSAKVSRNKIKIHADVARRSEFVNTNCSFNLQEFQGQLTEDIFNDFAREELIINGMFTGRKEIL